MVGAAEGVRDVGVGAVGVVPVVHRDPGEPVQNAEGVDSVAAAFVVQEVGGQPECAGRVQPPVAAQYPDPGLVEMRYGRRRDRRLDGSDEPLQRRCYPAQHRTDPASGHRHPAHLGQQLGGAGDRDVLIGQQIGGQRGDVRPVTGRGTRLDRRGGGGQHPAPATALMHPVFGHHRHNFGQVMHLTGHHTHVGAVPQPLTAARARRRAMLDDTVRVGNQLQVRTRRPRLLPLPPPGFTAQRLRRGLVIHILGRRFRRVLRVRLQLTFQLRHPRGQPLHLGPQHPDRLRLRHHQRSKLVIRRTLAPRHVVIIERRSSKG